MSYVEKSVMFGCKGEQLLGIISLPDTTSKKAAMHTGLVIVVGGPQYRAGSHRQFVLLARRLAAAGTPVLRFDYRGMGDSTGALHNFTNVNEDIACAISELFAVAIDVKSVVLWGLCDGASATLLYCCEMQDHRVKGLCLVNPWVRSDASLAKTQVKHYYTRRLLQKEFWVKLCSGKVAASAASGLLRKLSAAFLGNARATADKSFQSQMGRAWMQFKGPILLILSGGDYTAKEFLEYVRQDTDWAGALNRTNLLRHDLENADHTFSDSEQRQRMELICATWLVGGSTISPQLGSKS